MGSFYTNITLKTADTDGVIAAVREAGRSAFIAPPENGATVVFDQASEEQDPDVLQVLALDLARACKCAALAVLNHDDDVLAYMLFDSGKLVDEYNSAPGYFAGNTAAPPGGGDARRIAVAFGVPEREADVKRILRVTVSDKENFAFATDRHRELVTTLGLPAAAVGTGFTYIEEGELPDGLDVSTLRKV